VALQILVDEKAGRVGRTVVLEGRISSRHWEKLPPVATGKPRIEGIWRS